MSPSARSKKLFLPKDTCSLQTGLCTRHWKETPLKNVAISLGWGICFPVSHQRQINNPEFRVRRGGIVDCKGSQRKTSVTLWQCLLEDERAQDVPKGNGPGSKVLGILSAQADWARMGKGVTTHMATKTLPHPLSLHVWPVTEAIWVSWHIPPC